MAVSYTHLDVYKRQEDMTIQYLYVMDSNGENRKKTAKLENVQNVTAVLYRDNSVSYTHLR